MNEHCTHIQGSRLLDWYADITHHRLDRPPHFIRPLLLGGGVGAGHQIGRVVGDFPFVLCGDRGSSY
jgi:hypothetical protein